MLHRDRRRTGVFSSGLCSLTTAWLLASVVTASCAIGDTNDAASRADAMRPPTDGSRDDGAPATTLDAGVLSSVDVIVGADGGASETGCVARAARDPSTLPACCSAGHAHCVPSSDVAPSQASQLDLCTAGGYCVPDAFIRSGGAYTPRHCVSISGADGACESVCIPAVAAVMSALPQDVCATDERCAPCINPFSHTPTGACDPIAACDVSDAGVSTADAAHVADGAPSPDAASHLTCPYVGPPIIDPTTLPACCAAGGAHCVPSAAVPPSEASRLAPCSGGVCAPDPFIAAGGEFIPASCTPFDGGEGRCLSVCIPTVAAQPMLPHATCAANERCVPCFDPFTGASTGACSLSCDPGPRLPAVRFASCCDARGTCVPDALLTPAQIDHLEPHDCGDGIECVPNENLDPAFRPVACSGVNLFTGTAYTGFCVSNCAELTLLGRLTLDQGDCADAHTCVSCVNPLTGAPSGVPGC